MLWLQAVNPAVKLSAVLMSVIALSGCGDRDDVMGRTAGTPVPEPAQNSVHCDLIFPGN